ncbi:EF-P beta-lysylation protein EpmB [Marinobacterium nitratireducens]|uniref:L-lysine 2,3-aminomutase n=1 Tax=Marinobacterium nitratireducens TaxID=518897 RepID=A0A917ZBT9_9GAMM|nr:EF-P beta-lysylation protein EpmB [Marinobacterium nitratireducens]GGO78722.1 EF-P beta-lysylation protein EpmB [Marinobacterium nitratireducens]
MNLPLTQLDDWQSLLSHTLDDPAELLRQLALPDELLAPALEAAGDFPLRIPIPYLRRIRKGDPEDPLLRQVLPLGAERIPVPGFVSDPLAEANANRRDGLIHKYKRRVLLILSGACAINCRYCFRRHFPYDDNRLGPEQWREVLGYLRAHPEVNEVIFSGGDPLATSDRRLARFIADLGEIPHLTRLRIHSRLPVVIPQRVTDSLVDTLTSSRLRPVMVLHVNHGNEIDDEVEQALERLRRAGVTLLNQAVLLRGVNDSVAAQQDLSERLFAAGVLPYYLFVLDAVAGAAHFDVPDDEARRLMLALQAELPGFLVPRLAREIPGRPAKTLLGLPER